MNAQHFGRAARWAGVLVTALAVVIVTAASGRGLASAQAQATGCWSAWPVAPLGARLASIAAVSPNDIWAVGSYDPPGRGQQTLTEHWDGTRWNLVPSPNPGAFMNGLSSVAAFSPGDVWTVGSYGSAGTDSHTLAMHWDGVSWRVVPAPSPGVRLTGLTSIAGSSSNDVWAVGTYSPSVIDPMTLILHWDGTQWTVVPSPNPGKIDTPVPAIYSHALTGVAALAPNDAWAVGSYATGDLSKPHTLALHWDGHTWSQVPTGEEGQINALAALNSSDIWAVGYQGSMALVMRWDGSAWGKVSLPADVVPGGSRVRLQGIAAPAADDLWVVGSYATGETSSAALILHRDGQAWSRMATGFIPSAGYSDASLSSVAPASGDVWAAGSLYNGAGGPAWGLLARHTAAPCSSLTPVPTPLNPYNPPYPVPGSGSRTFPETGRTVSGIFLEYWYQHGGLAQQGYPVSSPLAELSDLNSRVYTMQYFERAVFEYHPENRAPNNVLLSLLGVFEYRQKYPAGAPGQQANNDPGSVLFPQTGHRLGGVFLGYWQGHGGLAQQGYPISDEFTEVSPLDGKAYTVQYFERAVFEYHPEHTGTPYEVLLSQLGTFRYHARYGPPVPQPIPTQGPLSSVRVSVP